MFLNQTKGIAHFRPWTEGPRVGGSIPPLATMPPNGGYGGNIGIHDAHNIAWKLALVVAGHADAKLLDTDRTSAAQRPRPRRNSPALPPCHRRDWRQARPTTGP
jgi:FAD binding domain